MIQLKAVDTFYGNHQALKQVTLDVEEGECVVLIGPSGCGKSTLLKSINRMVAFNDGAIYVDGKDIRTYQAQLLRRQMGYCIQGVGLFPHYTIYDNMAIVPRLLKWSEEAIKKRIEALMLMSELPMSYLDKKPHQLSGGEAQRVGVCRALAADPPILLMDEPFGAVDPLTRENLQVAFNHIQEALKKTVVFVTHDVEEALVVGDRIAVMNKGAIITCDTPGGLTRTQEDTFVKSFLGNDYALRLLKRYNHSDLLRHIRANDSHHQGQFPPVDHELQETYPLGGRTSVKEILAEMLRRNASEIQLVSPEGQVVLIQYADVVSFLHEVSG